MVEVISRYNDSPAAWHLGISRTTSMVKQNYVFKGMRRKVRAYVRTCDVCQRGKADTHLPRGKMWHLEIREEVGVGIGRLYLFARDDFEEFGCDCG